VKGRERYQVKISNRFAALENMDDEHDDDDYVDIFTAWVSVTEDIKVSVIESLGNYELKQHKPRFDNE
jgi:hypothetical protein